MNKSLSLFEKYMIGKPWPRTFEKEIFFRSKFPIGTRSFIAQLSFNHYFIIFIPNEYMIVSFLRINV